MVSRYARAQLRTAVDRGMARRVAQADGLGRQSTTKPFDNRQFQHLSNGRRHAAVPSHYSRCCPNIRQHGTGIRTASLLPMPGPRCILITVTLPFPSMQRSYTGPSSWYPSTHHLQQTHGDVLEFVRIWQSLCPVHVRRPQCCDMDCLTPRPHLRISHLIGSTGIR